jgi:hypothetical protein
MRSDGSVMMPGERAQHEERAQHDDEPARRSASQPRRDDVGPQGAALILELERLREAFDKDDANDLTARHASPRRASAGAQAEATAEKHDGSGHRGLP